MRVWELYHQLKEEIVKEGIKSLEIDIMFEEIENDLHRLQIALDEFEDPNLNSFIDQYPKPLGTNPKKGSYCVSVTVVPRLKPILVMEKMKIMNDSQGLGLDNSQITKRKFVGTVWFNSETEADNFMMAMKLTFGQKYEVR